MEDKCCAAVLDWLGAGWGLNERARKGEWLEGRGVEMRPVCKWQT